MKRNYVEQVVMDMGTPVGTKGFKYIVDAVMLLDNTKWHGAKWSSIYWKIAKTNDSTVSKVERNIRTALAATRNNLDNYDTVNHYIGYSNCQNSNSLSMLHEVIRRELVEENITEDDKVLITKECIRNMITDALTEIIDERLCLA